jgi:hypothetical protein
MKIKRWEIKAGACNRTTGMPVGKARTEIVGTDNTLFEQCITIIDAKEAYESWWNDLNPDSNEVVFVSAVKVL